MHIKNCITLETAEFLSWNFSSTDTSFVVVKSITGSILEWKITVCVIVDSPTSNPAELAATVPAVAAANTASPKFPQIEEMFKELSFLAYGPLNGRETNLVLSTVNFIERKLRA